jgi:hypothetical protein
MQLHRMNRKNLLKKTIADQNAAFIKTGCRSMEIYMVAGYQNFKNLYKSVRQHYQSRMEQCFGRCIKISEGKPTPDSIIINTDSFTVRREGNMAVVDYKQELNFPNAKPPFDKSISREQRILIKKNGKWLVASVTSTDITGIGLEGIELVT